MVSSPQVVSVTPKVAIGAKRHSRVDGAVRSNSGGRRRGLSASRGSTDRAWTPRSVTLRLVSNQPWRVLEPGGVLALPVERHGRPPGPAVRGEDAGAYGSLRTASTRRPPSWMGPSAGRLAGAPAAARSRPPQDRPLDEAARLPLGPDARPAGCHRSARRRHRPRGRGNQQRIGAARAAPGPRRARHPPDHRPGLPDPTSGTRTGWAPAGRRAAVPMVGYLMPR